MELKVVKGTSKSGEAAPTKIREFTHFKCAILATINLENQKKLPTARTQTLLTMQEGLARNVTSQGTTWQSKSHKFWLENGIRRIV